MERELLAFCEIAVKEALAAAKDSASSNGREVSRCVESLKRLKDFPVTGYVLVSTTVDKLLRHLRQHNKEKIRLLAKWVLEIWRKKIKEYLSTNDGKNFCIISSEKTHQDESTKSIINHEDSSRNQRKSESKGVFPVKNCKGISRTDGKDTGIMTPPMQSHQVESINCSISKRKFVGDSEFPAKKCENIVSGNLEAAKEKGFKMKPFKEPEDSEEEQKVISFKCCDASRDKVREVFLEALQRVGGEVDEEIKEQVRACDPVAVAISLESEMFMKMGPYNGAKKLKYRSIMFNMKDPKNPDLRRKILLGEVKPERLVTMSAEEMASNEGKSENNKIKEKLSWTS